MAAGGGGTTGCVESATVVAGTAAAFRAETKRQAAKAAAARRASTTRPMMIGIAELFSQAVAAALAEGEESLPADSLRPRRCCKALRPSDRKARAREERSTFIAGRLIPCRRTIRRWSPEVEAAVPFGTGWSDAIRIPARGGESHRRVRSPQTSQSGRRRFRFGKLCTTVRSGAYTGSGSGAEVTVISSSPPYGAGCDGEADGGTTTSGSSSVMRSFRFGP